MARLAVHEVSGGHGRGKGRLGDRPLGPRAGDLDGGVGTGGYTGPQLPPTYGLAPQAAR